MTREDLDFIGSMNMCDEISDDAYKKIVCHCEEQEPCEDAISRRAVLDLIYADWKYENLESPIENLPTVTPQMKSSVNLTSNLDKIRAEIAEYGSIMVSYAITKDTKTDKGIEKLVSGVLKQAKEQVLEIIDKYRGNRNEKHNT